MVVSVLRSYSEPKNGIRREPQDTWRTRSSLDRYQEPLAEIIQKPNSTHLSTAPKHGTTRMADINELVIEPLKQFAKDSIHLVKKCTKPDRKGK